MNLSAAQEERLVDIANVRPSLRGTRATTRALLRRKLIVNAGYGIVLTHQGHAVVAAILARRGRL